MNPKINELNKEAQALREQLAAVEKAIEQEEKNFSTFCKRELLEKGFVCRNAHKTNSSGKNTSDSGESFDFIVTPKDFKEINFVFEWSDVVEITFKDGTKSSFEDFPFGHAETEEEAWLNAFEKQVN
jgi:hypothetical protein